MSRVYIVKMYDKGTEQKATVEFTNIETAMKYMDIYHSLNHEVKLETREKENK